MVAFVVRFSYCFVTSRVNFLLKNNPFLLKHYSLIVTVIVYGVPGIEFSVFIWVIIILSGHVIFKGQAVYLLSYMFVSEPHAFFQCYIV